VPHDVPVDHIVPHDVPMPGPAPTSKPPVASAPPMGPDSPYAAKTPEENKFVDKPEYKDAAYHGRIVKSVDGRALSFADGKNFRPGRWDDATGKPVDDPSMANDSDPYIGDLGMCVPDPKHHELWNCTAFHSGQETPIGGKPAQTSTWSNPTPSHIDEARCQDKWAPMFDPQCKAKSADGTPPAMSMVNVDVDISGYSVKAMVDTGCSWPMAIPKVLANILLKDGRAARTSPAKSTLADGSVKDTDVIVINQITVDGRVLQDVVAAIGESDSAPILLGLGALNRLCHYSITDGRIVFTGNQPA